MTEPPLTTKPRPPVGPLPVTERMPMTAGRWLALAVGVPVALVLIGGAALSAAGLTGHISLLVGLQKTYQVTLAPVPVRGGTVYMKIDAGDAQFNPGRPGDHVARVTGTARYQGRRPTFTDRTSAGVASLQSSCTGRFPPCAVSYAVAVPTGTGLSATDTSGDLTLGHLTNGVTLHVGNGDISGPALAGRVTVTDQSGDVTLGQVTGQVQVLDQQGDVSLRSVTGSAVIAGESGDITLGQVSGRLRVAEGSGDVSFGPVTGPVVTVRDQSGDVTGQGLAAADVTVYGSTGDISLSFSRMPSRVQVTCTSGDVTLHLPPGRTPYRVITQDSHGSVSVNVPTDSSSANVISVTDGSGDISISQ